MVKKPALILMASFAGLILLGGMFTKAPVCDDSANFLA